jgi:TIM-barrel protein
MAGITNGNFCRRMSSFGFDIVTLGGYNIDKPSIEAGCKIIARGRPEFKVAEEDVLSHIKSQVNVVRSQNPWKGKVSVNLRATSPEPIITVSKLDGVDVVEINAHCRQSELVNAGCGQALLQNVTKLGDFIEEVVKNSGSKVSVKVRANVPGVDDLAVAEAVNNAGANYLHIDAMKPGYTCADYNLIRSIKKDINIFLIGNNSIKDLKSARKMVDAGADGISIARAAIGGKLPFDLARV